MTRVSGKEIRAVSAAVADLTFVPTATMMRVKAAFYAAWPGMKEPGPSDIAQVTESSAIRDWWAKPGFQEWFLNRETARAQLSYLKDLALRTAEEILCDPDANTAAKVNLIKNILIYNEALEDKQMARASVKIQNMSTEDIQKRLKEAIIDIGED